LHGSTHARAFSTTLTSGRHGAGGGGGTATRAAPSLAGSVAVTTNTGVTISSYDQWQQPRRRFSLRDLHRTYSPATKAVRSATHTVIRSLSYRFRATHAND
jgi:hypothetical protein